MKHEYEAGKCRYGGEPHRKTIPASSVGVSLTISDEAIAEGRRISLEQAIAVRKLRDFIWD